MIFQFRLQSIDFCCYYSSFLVCFFFFILHFSQITYLELFEISSFLLILLQIEISKFSQFYSRSLEYLISRASSWYLLSQILFACQVSCSHLIIVVSIRVDSFNFSFLANETFHYFIRQCFLQNSRLYFVFSMYSLFGISAHQLSVKELI